MNDRTYAIGEYETEIVVRPYLEREPTRLDRSFKWYRRPVEFYNGEARFVYPESVASLVRTVRFARENVSTRPFEIRYGTKDDGALSIAHEPRQNLFNPQMNVDEQAAEKHRRRGVAVVFEFDPETTGEGCLDLEIYKGFDRGNRNAHFHLTERNSDYTRRYRQLTYVLDLSAYQSQGFTLGASPGLWHEPDADHNCTGRAETVLDDERHYRKFRIEPTLTPNSEEDEWRWEWKLDSTLGGDPIDGGIIDVIWEHSLVPPFHAFVSHASEDKQTCVDPLVARLEAAGLDTWYDKDELIVGDHLLQSIVRGIGFSGMGIVILSPSFFKKTWTITGLEIFLSKESKGKFVLPVLHNMSLAELRDKCLELVQRLALQITQPGPQEELAVRVAELSAAQELVDSLGKFRIASMDEGLDRVTDEIIRQLEKLRQIP